MGSKNVRKFVWMLVLFATLLATCSPQTSFAQSSMNQGSQLSKEMESSPSPDQEQMILNATVQIYTISFVDGQGPEENGVKMLRALGTLVNCREGTLLVTHDHWEYLDQKGVVQFYDAEGSLFLEISTEEFSRSILYQDKGTLVLKFPAGWANHKLSTSQTSHVNKSPVPVLEANLGDAQAVTKGSNVYIARHQPDSAMKISLLAAEVVAVKSKKGVRVFILKSLDGDAIVRGDSGGGLWFNGQLIGNTWLAYPVTQRSLLPGHSTETHEIYLDKSTSAQLPVNFLNTFASP